MFKLTSITVSLLLLSNTAMAETEAGKTMIARGTVEAVSSEDQSSRKLRRRSPIFGTDTVATGDNAKAQLRMRDGGMIALKENSELFISDYNFSAENGRGNVVMELVKGGLRSVTGSIKAESGDYKLKTPVGSIGIRGTHYEVEIVGSTIWVAVWDGAVDLDITSGDQAGSTLSLGQDEGYSYASIDANGAVTTYVEPPETFESGMTTDADEVDQEDEAEDENTEEESQESSSSVVATNSVAVQITTEEDAEEEAEAEQAEQEAVADAEEENSQEIATAAEAPSITPPEPEPEEITPDNSEFETALSQAEIESIVMARTATVSFGGLSDVSVTNANGEAIEDLSVNMTVDFATDRVSDGNMTMTDSGGEWFATFDGYLDGGDILVDFSYVAHGDQLGEGQFDAIRWLDGGETVWAGFTLQEVLNPEINVTGSFIIK